MTPADRGYRGVDAPRGALLLISHARRPPRRLKKLLKRCQMIEPMIGHLKSDRLPGRNWFKGEIGDAMHAVLCGTKCNLRQILAHLRALLLASVPWLPLVGHRLTTYFESMLPAAP